jgi:hypothetical protein
MFMQVGNPVLTNTYTQNTEQGSLLIQHMIKKIDHIQFENATSPINPCINWTAALILTYRSLKIYSPLHYNDT